MPETPNHGYNVPNEGEENWDEPLNENFEQYDVDIEVRDAAANRSTYDPQSGAKFLATDTGVVYEGDGTSWVKSLVVPAYDPGTGLVTITADGAPALSLTGESGGGAGNVVAGHSSNTVTSGTTGGSIGGGGYDDGSSSRPNTVTGNFGTVAGGRDNDAASLGTVAGGTGNSASGRAATVGGGRNNEVSGEAGICPGGAENTVTGAYGFAGGQNASSQHDGAFVWADSSDSGFTSVKEDEFAVQADGGVYLYSSGNTSTGVELFPGSGSWSSASSRTMKSNVDPVDGQAVLEGVEDLEVSTWSYDAEDGDVRHMGPMAEAFHDAFGLGDDRERIGTVDADGVALAAIKGLAERLSERDDRVEELEAENEELRDRLSGLEARVSDLEATERTAAPADD